MLQDIVALRRSYRQITEQRICLVEESDYADLSGHLKDLEILSQVENRAVSLYDIHRKQFIMKVGQHLSLLGYDEQMPDMRIERYHAMIHPDDLPYVYDAEIGMHRFLSDKGAQKKRYKLVYDYRVRGKSGEYVRFLHQMAIYALDRQDNAWLMLILSDVLSAFPEEELPRRFIIDMTDNSICMFNEELGVVRELVTPREREILVLISQGLQSDAIADRLCISVHTVNNHRQNILMKTRTKHMAQAIFYLRCIGVM